jgi:Pirin C-terminal cupin domain
VGIRGTSLVNLEGGISYAGHPQGDRIVSYGPFIGDSKQDNDGLFAEYQAGRFPCLSELEKQHVPNGLLENSPWSLGRSTPTNMSLWNRFPPSLFAG